MMCYIYVYEHFSSFFLLCTLCVSAITIKGDLQTTFRFSYLKVHKLITLGTKFKNL